MVTIEDSERRVHVPTKVTPDSWWTLAVLFCVYFFCLLDRYILSMLVPDIKAELALSDIQMGLILGPAFSLFYAFFGVPIGWASDIFPRRWIIFLGIIVFSTATVFTGFAGGFATLFLARVLVGIGEASVSPSANSLLADKFPREQLATAISIYHIGVKIGTASAYVIGGAGLAISAAVIAVLPFMGDFSSWRIVIMFCGVPAVFFALLVFTFREPVRPPQTKSDVSPAHLVLFIRKQARLLLPMLGGFTLIAFSANCMAGWVPTYLVREFGWSRAEFGPILGAIGLITAATLIFKGIAMDWLFGKGVKDIHIRFYTWLLAITTPIGIALFFIPNTWLFVLCYALIQIVAVPITAYVATVIQVVTPVRLRGQMMACVSFCLIIVGGFGPTIIGMLTDLLFRDEGKVGYSLAMVITVAFPTALFLLRMALKPLRAVVLDIEASEGEIKGAH
ncbi:MAG: MFS transporter [Hyphomonadaceae bacterium]|nr:MFS transporter [Hyphomonadaceae bacterium]